MTTVKNEVFIGLLHENFYLVERELTFGGGRNCPRCGMNEQILGKLSMWIWKKYFLISYVYLCIQSHFVPSV